MQMTIGPYFPPPSSSMPDKSQGRVSWLSRFKKLASPSFSSSSTSPPAHPPPSLSSAPPHRHPPLPSDNTGRSDSPSHHADTELPVTSPSHLTSGSRPSAPSIVNAKPIGPPLAFKRPTRQLEDSTSQTHSSMHLGPPTLLQFSEGQTSTYQEPSMFGGAHDFVMKNPVFNDYNNYNNSTDSFMEKFLQQTIIGAEFDSSDRDPPPRCHPGTRLAIIERCLDFIIQCQDKEKLRWVVGPAGVGKSAVMQMVTETVPDGVVFTSIFLSVSGRRDGTKVVLTIAYQLAVKSGPYRQFIRDQIAIDPSLLRKSLSVQFNKFIVEPFMLRRLFDPSCRFLVVIDGLDECDSHLTQQTLLELITDFCITHPTSSIAWIVASRPEPHITSFFDKPEVQPVYIKEEIKIDSNEACEEVQQYLRDELKKIKLGHPTLKYKREWPLEHEFTKIASAAGGLFAYAATVVRYIGDPTHGGPAAQLRRVLEIIDASAKDDGAAREHPMDRLDALYKRILSNVPGDVMANTRNLLVMSQATYGFSNLGFRSICNALGLSEDDAYDAICHLHAVMKIPEPAKAESRLSYYHKSFGDFLSDFKRSGFSRNFNSESYQIGDRTVLRIVEEVQDDSDALASGEGISADLDGLVKARCDNISLSWPGDERFEMTDEQLRFTLYKKTMDWVQVLFTARDNLHGSISCFHMLTTRFTAPGEFFPFYRLRDCAFDRFGHELAKLGKLRQVPLRTLEYAAVCGDVELLFTRPTRSNVKVSDPWNPSCKHRKIEVNGLEQRRAWSTKFQTYCRVDSGAEDDEDANLPGFHVAMHQRSHKKWVDLDTKLPRVVACIQCSRRFAQHFMNNPELHATIFVDLTGMCYVEFSFVDSDDGVSEWRYRFFHSGRPSSIDV